jgi:hypothetical protein
MSIRANTPNIQKSAKYRCKKDENLWEIQPFGISRSSNSGAKNYIFNFCTKIHNCMPYFNTITFYRMLHLQWLLKHTRKFAITDKKLSKNYLSDRAAFATRLVWRHKLFLFLFSRNLSNMYGVIFHMCICVNFFCT